MKHGIGKKRGLGLYNHLCIYVHKYIRLVYVQVVCICRLAHHTLLSKRTRNSNIDPNRPNQHVCKSCKTSKVTLRAEIMGSFVEASCFPKVFAIQMYSTYTINMELKNSIDIKSFSEVYTLEDQHGSPTNHPFRKEHDLPNLHDYVPC